MAGREAHLEHTVLELAAPHDAVEKSKCDRPMEDLHDLRDGGRVSNVAGDFGQNLELVLPVEDVVRNGAGLRFEPRVNRRSLKSSQDTLSECKYKLERLSGDRTRSYA